MNVQRINIRVIPNASKNSIATMEDGTIKVRLTTAPVDGKANVALITFLAKHFGVSKGSIRIVRGRASKNKIIDIQKNGE